jgi:hypothetical protein
MSDFEHAELAALVDALVAAIAFSPERSLAQPSPRQIFLSKNASDRRPV